MNLLPLIHHSRKKNFISPLSGTMLSTSQFHPDDPYDKLGINASPTNSMLTSKLRSAKTEHKFKQTKGQEESSLTGRKRFKSTRLYQTLDPNTSHQEKVLVTPRVVKEQCTSTFIFPKVEIIPLYLITQHSEIKALTLTVKLEQYFKLFFSPKLNHASSQLITILSTYFPLLSESSFLQCSIEKRKWPSQFWQVRNTQQFLELLKFYTAKSAFWYKYIFVLLRLYCLPAKETRTRILDNLILSLKKQFSAKSRIPPQKTELILLKEDGTKVNDIMEIAFDTNKLYICRGEEDHTVTFQRFVKMEQEYEIAIRKKGFNGRLRNHFRREIVAHKYDEDSVNYHVDFQEVRKQREESLEKAMKLLEVKKQRSRNNVTALSIKEQHAMPQRPKSKESLWKEQNIQDSQVHPQLTRQGLYFNLNVGSKKIEEAIRQKFKYYHQLSLKQDPNLQQKQILLYVLEKYHPVLSKLTSDPFNSQKLMKVLEVLTDSKIPEAHQHHTMKWRHFVQLQILSSKNVQQIIKLPDCYQILRNFAEGYLNMKEEDYFRDELVNRLYRTIEGDKEGLALMEEVIWSWLETNGFVKHEAVQREVLWSYPARSKTFYLLVTSMALGTFQTTPLDLAHELLF